MNYIVLYFGGNSSRVSRQSDTRLAERAAYWNNRSLNDRNSVFAQRRYDAVQTERLNRAINNSKYEWFSSGTSATISVIRESHTTENPLSDGSVYRNTNMKTTQYTVNAWDNSVTTSTYDNRTTRETRGSHANTKRYFDSPAEAVKYVDRQLKRYGNRVRKK